ncbi:MAG: InlB B-repeat-containing protein [Oscillospiraceae bacterium]
MGVKTLLTTMSMKVKIIVLCAVISIAGGITAVVLVNASKADTYRVLKVFELTGSAIVTRQGTGDIDAYVGMNLESGDMLTVCDGSVMRVSMDGDKYVLLDEGTVLELVAEGTRADSRTSINLKEGTILNELTTSLSANSSYEISTPKATMAVRGTSFMVSVEQNEDGSYNIRTNTFHGKVEVMLLDSEGNPTGKSVMVTEDNGVVIRTVPNSETGNPAEVDGTSFFVYELEPGVFVEVPDGEDPVRNIVYEYISNVIKEYALRSNDDRTMVLSEYIIRKLRGDLGDVSVSTTTVTTTVPETEVTTVSTTETTTVPETEVTTVPTTETTTVPETEVTTVPTTKTTTVPKAKTTAVPTTKTTTAPTTKTTTVPETKTTTVPTTKTTTVPKPKTTTVPTTKTTTAPTTKTTTVPTIETVTIPPTGTTTVPTTWIITNPETTTTPAEIKSFKVSFLKDGITIYTVVVDKGGTVANIPDVPEKEGHTGKWKYNGAEFTSETVITGNTLVVAEYTPIEYTVVFKSGSNVISTKTVAYGSTVLELPIVPAKTGYTGKWTYNGAEFTEETVVTGNMIVDAEYTLTEYTVTFKADGTTVSTQTAAYGQTVATLPTVPDKTGYTGKWMYNGAEFTASTVITGNITVEAEYTAIEYTVTFKADGTTVSTRTAAYGQTVTTLPTVPDKTGYTGKWMYNGSEFTASTVITGNITVEAEYTAIEYTVTFKADGTTVSTQTAAYGQTVATLPTVPDKTGYTGKWMYNGSEFTASTVITGNITVEAEYTANEYTVTFIANNDSIMTTRTAAYGTTVTDIPDVPGKTGYTGKWMYNGSEFTTSTVITGNITVEAEYTAIEYTVTFTANNDSIMTTRTAAYGTTVTDIPDVPGKTGYTGKWMYNGAEFTASTVITGNITVEAEYTAIEYTVTFKADGTTVSTRTAAYSQTVTTLPTVPDKTGYTGKWMYNGSEFTASTVITGNITVEAEYTAIEYTVTFKADGTTVSTQTAAYGQTVTTLPTVPDKTGYTGKWMYNGSEFTALTVITGNITVEAEYTAIEYTVTFKADGTTVSTQTAAYGQTVTTLPTVPDKTGYTGKWMYNGSEFTASTVITGNITVEAEYTIGMFKVTYVLSADPTVVIDSQEDVPYGEVPPAVSLPTVLDTDSDGTYDYYLLNWSQPTDPITDNTVISVAYEEYANVVEVKITDADGEICHYLAKLGDTITLPPAAADHAGFEFVGWGAVTSGGYADSSYKEGCTDITDSTYSDYYEYDSGTAPLAKGGTVTLTGGNRLYDYYYGETNFKFVAVYVRKYTVTFVEGGVTLATAEIRGGENLSAAINKVNLTRSGYDIVFKSGDTVIDPDSWTIYGDEEITVEYVSQ